MRIVSWNIENLAPRIGEVRALLEGFGNPEVLCLQEARIRASDAALIAAMARSAPGYVCHYSLNRDPVNASFRGGRAHGVVTFLSTRLAPGAAEVPEWDLEGRFVASKCSSLTIGNVYAVNGTDKRYFDHDGGRFFEDRHAFKRRFQERVFDWARNRKRIVIAGDWNVSQTKLDTHPRLRTEEPHTRARAEFAAHLAASTLVDVYRELHPQGRGYTWFNPRARSGRLDAARVDFVLVSRDLLPFVSSVLILDNPDLRRGSDHAPVVLELRDDLA